MLPVQDLDRLAFDVLFRIDRFLLDESIVEYILAVYDEFCRSDEARRQDISKQPITDEMRLRLRFECLCFCTWCASVVSEKYLTHKGWFGKRRSQKLIELFDGAITAKLIEVCRDTGMTALHEITLVAIHPKLPFGPGDHLDPLNRLEEYREAFVDAPGTEVEPFGKRVGKALDAGNHPLFDTIGGTFGTCLLRLSDRALAKAIVRR